MHEHGHCAKRCHAENRDGMHFEIANDLAKEKHAVRKVEECSGDDPWTVPCMRDGADEVEDGARAFGASRFRTTRASVA